ncbi:YphA family membrane protein [Virgibacillus flavescens]|uniref:YphA family membrane protein n=1 Tax=Virgibacillus flavescens TaxID=1611422 RepID=UPI003D356DC5
MTSGLVFYWFGWLIWIYAAFIMNIGKWRTFLVFWLLLIICFSTITISVNGYNLALSLLLVICGAMVMLAKQKYLIFNLFSSITIMILYLSIMLWENYFPLWMIHSKMFVMPFMIAITVLFISKGFSDRISIMLAGVCIGELVHSFILASYSIPDTFGGYAFLDTVMIIVFLFSGIETAKVLFLKLRTLGVIYKKSFKILSKVQ